MQNITSYQRTSTERVVMTRFIVKDLLSFQNLLALVVKEIQNL